ncbi:CTLH/CRA C-terminal to lish motif domain-containing protein [Limtongia smithiae]|uniref:CTLH/CRA C-terminal to lish motif domain-containing protein n=1 Tax=Limtongia smithiae TaxID=1125753 RepID=UPI0034CFD263
MEPVAKEFARVERAGDFGRYVSEVDGMLDALARARSTIDAAPQSRREQATYLRTRATEFATRIGSAQKEVHGALSKYGKALDKKFKSDVGAAYNGAAFSGSSRRGGNVSDATKAAKAGEANGRALLDRAIAMHLIREGEFEVADTLIAEAGLAIPASLEREFVELYRILAALERRDLAPAIAWAASRRAQLTEASSNLEFTLHSLQFVSYFMENENEDNKGPDRALAYARANFAQFGEKYLSEISKLMCGFLFKANLAASPYASVFLSPLAWSDVARALTKEFCGLLGLSSESPLGIATAAGAIALPTLLKMGSIMRETQTEWTSENELPVEIPLPASFQFHAIFVCPVSKEQTTDENPPMMMPCGHIVAKESLARMSKQNPNQRFKCPYCPSESIPTQAIRVYF